MNELINSQLISGVFEAPCAASLTEASNRPQKGLHIELGEGSKIKKSNRMVSDYIPLTPSPPPNLNYDLVTQNFYDLHWQWPN